MSICPVVPLPGGAPKGLRLLGGLVPLAIAAVGGFAVPAVAAGSPVADLPGAVYTMTNSATGNAVEAFSRAAAGALKPAGTFATGGNGGPLGSGHSIAVSRDGRTVVAVNAGSNSISAFDVRPQGLRLIDAVSSGGVDPNSVTIRGDLVRPQRRFEVDRGLQARRDHHAVHRRRSLRIRHRPRGSPAGL